MLRFKSCGPSIIGLLALLLFLVSCTEKKEIIQVVQADLGAYIGSEACQSCHALIYDSFKKTGHPYKLTPVDSAKETGYYPFTQLPGPPPAYSWDDVTYVIGGFWWKARFVGVDGKIITAGGNNQYNFETEEWVDYHADEDKDYDCGGCHTTGYSSEGHQDGLEGIVGTWAFPGIQCEECHGKGSLHARSPKDYSMTIDRSSAQCGKCHLRDDPYVIDASGGYIRHHEQYDEILASKKAGMACVECHDPHVGLHKFNPERDQAIKNKCESCHFQETASFMNSELGHYAAQVECIDCHMPYAAKSATAVDTLNKADVRSHLFAINTDPAAEMFSASGPANGYLTVEYVCIQCHATKDKAWALSYANRSHAEPAGPTTCFDCHGDDNTAVLAAEKQWENSQHSTGENIDRASSTSCSYCHSNEGFVALLETGTRIGVENPTGIGCFTCHAPHSTGSLQVRTDESYTLENGVTVDYGEGNLCINCHHSRRDVRDYVYDGVEMSSDFGPHHSNQGDMLAGTGGYEYSGVTYSNSPHTIQVETEDGCVACHMGVSDRYFLGGHSVNMEWEEEEHTDACDQAGCHGSIGTFNYKGAQTTVEALLEELRERLYAANLLDEDGYPVERVVTTADSAGAVYNYAFVEEDQSRGVHNTAYAVGLLQSTLDFLGAEPGLSAVEVTTPPTVDGFATDAAWSQAEEFTVSLGDGMEDFSCGTCHSLNSSVQVKLKAVYTPAKLYVLASWPDNTASFTRSGSWSFGTGSWTRPNSSQSEDRIAFFFPIGTIGGDDYSTGGCMTKCHTDGSGVYLTTGRADMWHMKAARSLGVTSASGSGLSIDGNTHEVTGGTLFMTGWMDDKYVDEWRDHEDVGRYGDDGSSTYSHNRILDSSRPKYMESNPTDFMDAMVLTQAEIDAGEATGDATDGVSDDSAAVYWPNYASLKAVVPERILDDPTGSRGDITQAASWSYGTWTTEIVRDLDTGNDDDVQFTPGNAYTFGISIMDNGGGHDHKPSGKLTLKLIQSSPVPAARWWQVQR